MGNCMNKIEEGADLGQYAVSRAAYFRIRGKMKLEIIRVLLTAVISALSFSAEAQQPNKVPKIGFLAVVPLSTLTPRTDGFRQGLRELGYVEGKNIIIEWRSADGKLDRVPALAAELVQSKVDVIVTGGSRATESAKQQRGRFPSSWRMMAIPLLTSSLPASHGLAGTSRDCPLFPPRPPENGWSF